MNNKTMLVNARVPSDIVKWIDGLVEKGIYNNRSEAMRDFIRSYILKRREEP